MDNLKLPIPLKVNKNILNMMDDLERKGDTIVSFAGMSVIETIFQLYLIKKYKSKCVPFAKHNDFKRPIGLTIFLKQRYTKEEDKYLNDHFIQVAKLLVECIRKGEETVMIPLNYIREKSGHANVLIYRSNKSELEHFEPHGNEYLANATLQNVSKKKILLFTNILNLELKKEGLSQVKYIEASEVCPYIKGMQTFESNSKLLKSKDEPSGYCSAWSMFFAELCLKNPQLSSSEILDNIYIYLSTKPSAGDYLKKMIRGYAGYFVEKVNTYLAIFFKPKATVSDLLYYSKIHKIDKLLILERTLNILVELESTILLNPDFDLVKELKETKELYRQMTKGMTKDEQRDKRQKNAVLRNLYYKKRILQNYEEYSKQDDISEPILDMQLDITRDKMINPLILNKGLLSEATYKKPIALKSLKKTNKTLKVKKSSPKTKTVAKTKTVKKKTSI